MKKTGERLILHTRTNSAEDQIAYLRSITGYNFILKNLKNSQNCLEIGCTEGFGTEKIADIVKSMTAVDKDKEIIRYAKSKNKKNISYLVADAVSLPFKDKNFDCVVSLHVIEHIKDDNKFLSEVKKVLMPDGTFFCSTPNKSIRYVKKKPWNRFHMREYSYSEFQTLLQRHFKDVKVYCISAKGEIYKFERKRLRKIMFLNKVDFLGLRKLIPPTTQSNIIENMKTIIHKAVTKKQKKYSLKDFFIAEKDSKQCLDLIAIAKK